MNTAKLLDPPDDLEIEAGARGEVMVARIRLWIVALLAPIPLINALDYPHWENWVGTVVIAIALVAALLIRRAVRRDPRRSWIGLASTTADVTLITLSLSVFIAFGEPLTATNSMVVFGAYYVAIVATALRHDPRLSMLAGALAVTQYGAMVWVAATSFDLLEPGVFSPRYGAFSWGTQLSRMILMLATAALTTIVILRQGELLHRSSVDSLTLLYNRQAFSERLATEATRSRRHRHPLSVAMIDIDHFKQINDGYGHAAGDHALVHFADALRSEFRQTDLLARWGGEEFIVMMPETAPDAATAKLERFVSHIAGRSFELSRKGPTLRMTVSAGVAGVPNDLEDPGRLLDLADARLLAAKRGGRNRVIGVNVPVPGLT